LRSLLIVATPYKYKYTHANHQSESKGETERARDRAREIERERGGGGEREIAEVRGTRGVCERERRTEHQRPWKDEDLPNSFKS